MCLNRDRWSASATALELIPGRRVRPTTTYFRAGYRLLDSLTHTLSQQGPPARFGQASRPSAIIFSTTLEEEPR
jgi:hypothetical protein